MSDASHVPSKKKLSELVEYMEACKLIACNGAEIHSGSAELRHHAQMLTAVVDVLTELEESAPASECKAEPSDISPMDYKTSKLATDVIMDYGSFGGEPDEYSLAGRTYPPVGTAHEPGTDEVRKQLEFSERQVAQFSETIAAFAQQHGRLMSLAAELEQATADNPLAPSKRSPFEITNDMIAAIRGAPASAQPPLSDYLKDGETAVECIERNRRDVVQALGLLAKAKKLNERFRDAINRDPGESLVEFDNRLRALRDELRATATKGCDAG